MSCNKSQSALEVLPLFPSLCDIVRACVRAIFALVALNTYSNFFKWILAGVYVQFANTRHFLSIFFPHFCSIHTSASTTGFTLLEPNLHSIFNFKACCDANLLFVVTAYTDDGVRSRTLMSHSVDTKHFVFTCFLSLVPFHFYFLLRYGIQHIQKKKKTDKPRTYACIQKSLSKDKHCAMN